MAIHHMPAADPLLEQRPAPGEEPARQPLNILNVLGFEQPDLAVDTDYAKRADESPH